MNRGDEDEYIPNIKGATSENLYQTGIYLHWFIIQLCNFTKIRGESQALCRKVTFIYTPQSIPKFIRQAQILVTFLYSTTYGKSLFFLFLKAAMMGLKIKRPS